MKTPEVENHLADLEENLLRAIEFVQNSTFEDFREDHRTQYAVVRALEIVGESSKRVPDWVRALEPAVPWKAMAGMRDRLIHAYDDVNLELVWSTIRVTIPPLLPRIAELRRRIRASSAESSSEDQ